MGAKIVKIKGCCQTMKNIQDGRSTMVFKEGDSFWIKQRNTSMHPIAINNCLWCGKKLEEEVKE